MDIHDILDSVTADSTPAESDLQSLVRAWVNERVAPEILPYPEALLERTMERMRKQVAKRFKTVLYYFYLSNLELPARRERTD